MKVKKATDTFKLFDDHIQVISKSGSVYEITLNHCNCRGFGFHKGCRHFDEAKKLGLLLKLQETQKSSELTVNDFMRKIRKDAIRQFLNKNHISFSESVVDYIETILKKTTTPKEVLEIAAKS